MPLCMATHLVNLKQPKNWLPIQYNYIDRTNNVVLLVSKVLFIYLASPITL